MQKIVKIIIFIIFLFIISVFYKSLTRDTNYNTSNLINKEVSEFKIAYFNERDFYTKEDLKKNDYTLINFWASSWACSWGLFWLVLAYSGICSGLFSLVLGLVLDCSGACSGLFSLAWVFSGLSSLVLGLA